MRFLRPCRYWPSKADDFYGSESLLLHPNFSPCLFSQFESPLFPTFEIPIKFGSPLSKTHPDREAKLIINAKGVPTPSLLPRQNGFKLAWMIWSGVFAIFCAGSRRFKCTYFRANSRRRRFGKVWRNFRGAGNMPKFAFHSDFRVRSGDDIGGQFSNPNCRPSPFSQFRRQKWKTGKENNRLIRRWYIAGKKKITVKKNWNGNRKIKWNEYFSLSTFMGFFKSKKKKIERKWNFFGRKSKSVSISAVFRLSFLFSEYNRLFSISTRGWNWISRRTRLSLIDCFQDGFYCVKIIFSGKREIFFLFTNQNIAT